MLPPALRWTHLCASERSSVSRGKFYVNIVGCSVSCMRSFHTRTHPVTTFLEMTHIPSSLSYSRPPLAWSSLLPSSLISHTNQNTLWPPPTRPDVLNWLIYSLKVLTDLTWSGYSSLHADSPIINQEENRVPHTEPRVTY